jgi:endonuclease/exonuclease/phosphatase family metal-dependent hydrolase
MGAHVWPHCSAVILGDLPDPNGQSVRRNQLMHSGNRAFVDLLDDGLVDAAAARGDPHQMTWPRDRWFPPMFRIDHVLTRGAVSVTELKTGDGAGSDHRPLIAKVAVGR